MVGDFDGDGWQDIFYPAGGNGPDKLFINDRDGTFTDRAADWGIALEHRSTAAAAADFNNDGRLDIFVTSLGPNSAMAAGHHKLYRNNGGTFTDRTGTSNTNQDGTEMGMTVADWDEDADFDFYVTTIGTNNLYINQGSNSFVNQAASAGVVNTGWGWGTAAVDFDHDTLVDLVATAQGGRNYAFHNDTAAGGALSFQEIAGSIGLGASIDGRGLSNLDYDNDGDQDLMVFVNNGSAKLFRNDLSGPDTHWLRIFLNPEGISGIAPGGIGSVVRITLGARTLIGRVDSGSNYLSQSEMSAHFGLGATTMVDEVRVEWSNGGEVTIMTDVAADQTLTILPADTSIFTDGFESGDLTAWSSSVP